MAKATELLYWMPPSDAGDHSMTLALQDRVRNARYRSQ
jgi:hypothetical protein